jgi:hypothetical protein
VLLPNEDTEIDARNYDDQRGEVVRSIMCFIISVIYILGWFWGNLEQNRYENQNRSRRRS